MIAVALSGEFDEGFAFLILVGTLLTTFGFIFVRWSKSKMPRPYQFSIFCLVGLLSFVPGFLLAFLSPILSGLLGGP
jgi:hypothetical protein